MFQLAWTDAMMVFYDDDAAHKVGEVGYDVDAQVMQERLDELRAIEQDVCHVAEITRELSALLALQGDDLEESAAHVVETRDTTADGAQFLERALQHVRDSRALLMDASAAVAGTGLGALGFLAGPLVGVPTLVGGMVLATGIIVIHRVSTRD